jgi:hypothetical protein
MLQRVGPGAIPDSNEKSYFQAAHAAGSPISSASDSLRVSHMRHSKGLPRLDVLRLAAGRGISRGDIEMVDLAAEAVGALCVVKAHCMVSV